MATMMKRRDLIAEIETFLRETGMRPSTFGLDALNDGKLVADLRAGRRVWPETESAIRAFMARRRKKRA